MKSPEVDRDWIREMVERFESPLTLYAVRFTGSVDGARDVVQETFLRLCQQNRASVEPHVAEWLYTVCRNRALDVLRKEKRMKPLTSNQAELREAGQPTPPEAAEQKESTSRILGELRALPSDQQEVIRLKFQHGLSYKEISRITGFSGSHVGVLIHRGIQQLRYELRGAPGS